MVQRNPSTSGLTGMNDDQECPVCGDYMDAATVSTGGRVGFYCQEDEIFVPEGVHIQVEHIR